MLVKSDDISIESNAKSKLTTVCLPNSDTVEKWEKEKSLHKYITAQLVWNCNGPHDLSTFVAYHSSCISLLSSAKRHRFDECIHSFFCSSA